MALENADRLAGEPMFKRPFDVLLSSMALAVTSPVLAGLAACIRLEDGGPTFFRQMRIGRGGVPFTMVKFRSMTVDPAAVERQARADDPRVTSVGRFMRRTGLDELPQLWNIWVGDMSFVGPRPQPEREQVLRNGLEENLIVRHVPRHEVRMLVRPGLTGVAQVFAPRVVDHRKKFRYDAIYVRRLLQAAHARGNRSIGSKVVADLRLLGMDVALMARSIWMGARGSREV